MTAILTPDMLVVVMPGEGQSLHNSIGKVAQVLHVGPCFVRIDVPGIGVRHCLPEFLVPFDEQGMCSESAG